MHITTQTDEGGAHSLIAWCVLPHRLSSSPAPPPKLHSRLDRRGVLRALSLSVHTLRGPSQLRSRKLA